MDYAVLAASDAASVRFVRGQIDLCHMHLQTKGSSCSGKSARRYYAVSVTDDLVDAGEREHNEADHEVSERQ